MKVEITLSLLVSCYLFPILFFRNDNVKSLDETFWECAFTVQGPSTFQESLQSAPDSTLSDSEASFVPSFLTPVLDKIVLSGKSMEMLQNLGRLNTVMDDAHSKSGLYW